MKDKLLYAVSMLNLILFSSYLFSFTSSKDKATEDLSNKILKVRGIVIVDSSGIERVIVGAHLPEPNFAAGSRTKARKKNGSVSGVMLYDSEGQERGGYVTDDNYGNAFLTLDSKTAQQMLLIAEPQGAATMQVWSRNGKNKASLSANDADADITLKKNEQAIKLYTDEH